eukprot:GHRR01017124.1.p2 GENE.GHRR01017124.1~~GHRR01017124.1.p2  ORF type:complete len:120 (-),score=33.91 GHRR01017124.1:630-989(-)
MHCHWCDLGCPTVLPLIMQCNKSLESVFCCCSIIGKPFTKPAALTATADTAIKAAPFAQDYALLLPLPLLLLLLLAAGCPTLLIMLKYSLVCGMVATTSLAAATQHWLLFWPQYCSLHT